LLSTRRIGPILLAWLLVAGPLLGRVEAEGRTTESSVLARLASRSLLLGAARAGDSLVAVGERGHVLISRDAGESWEQVVAPTRVTLTAVHLPTPEVGFAVGHDSVILKTGDGGRSWERQHEAPDLESPLLDVLFLNAERGFAVGAYGQFLETTDGGKRWESRMISDLDVHHNAIVASDDGQLYIAGEQGSLFRSSDGGTSWETLESPSGASFFGGLALPGGRLMLFGLGGRVFRSGPGGEDWQRIENDTQSSLMGGAIGAEGRTIVLGGIAGVLLESRDGGESFDLSQRPDRKAVADALVTQRGVVLFGAFGVEAGMPRPAGEDRP